MSVDNDIYVMLSQDMSVIEIMKILRDRGTIVPRQYIKKLQTEYNLRRL